MNVAFALMTVAYLKVFCPQRSPSSKLFASMIHSFRATIIVLTIFYGRCAVGASFLASMINPLPNDERNDAFASTWPFKSFLLRPFNLNGHFFKCFALIVSSCN